MNTTWRETTYGDGKPHKRKKPANLRVDETITLAQFITHAHKFGTALVYETAESYLTGAELLQLERELKAVDQERRKMFEKVPQRKRMPKSQKLKTVVWLSKEGLPASRIATQMGISKRYVERLMQEAREQGLD